jgi:hypothetical protein
MYYFIVQVQVQVQLQYTHQLWGHPTLPSSLNEYAIVGIKKLETQGLPRPASVFLFFSFLSVFFFIQQKNTTHVFILYSGTGCYL